MLNSESRVEENIKPSIKNTCETDPRSCSQDLGPCVSKKKKNGGDFRQIWGLQDTSEIRKKLRMGSLKEGCYYYILANSKAS